MVDGRIGGGSCRSGRHVSPQFVLAVQRLDDGRARARLDQHSNYSWCSLLLYRDAHRFDQTLARKGFHGPALETRSGYLPCYAKIPSGLSSEIAILTTVSICHSCSLPIAVHCVLCSAHRLLRAAHFVLVRRLSYERVSFGALVFHERAKKILASADYPLPCYAGRADSFHIGFRGRALHLHALLE
jgi:hypothetical protein